MHFRNLYEHQIQLSGTGRRPCQSSGTWGYYWIGESQKTKSVKLCKRIALKIEVHITHLVGKAPSMKPMWPPCWVARIATWLELKNPKLGCVQLSHLQEATLQHFQRGCYRQVEMGRPVHLEPRWAPGSDEKLIPPWNNAEQWGRTLILVNLSASLAAP